MALNTKFTRANLRDIVRREIADTGTRWWTDAELNRYVASWQDRVQDEQELVWGSATITATGTTTYTYTDIATDVLRPDTVYINNMALFPKSPDEMEHVNTEWRAVETNTRPIVLIPENPNAFSVWPPQSSTAVHILVLEYPRKLTFAADTSTMELPAWAKYSARTYGAFRAFVRRGSTHNSNKAVRYMSHFDAQLKTFGKRLRNYFPKRSQQLRPASVWEVESLDPTVYPSVGTTAVSTITLYNFVDEVPTGAINSTNTTFTVSTAPNPGSSLEFTIDGVTLGTDTDASAFYTLTAASIVISAAPLTGQDLFTRYRVAIT